jgi:hypothetical protein
VLEKNEASRNVRIRDVAAAAGVSVTTVSNVLNKPHLVQEDTRELVADVMKDLDYKPNAHAVALRRDNSGRNPSEPSPHPEQLETVLPEPTSITETESPDNSTAGSWGYLRVGDYVQVRGTSQGNYEGVIDAIMPDFSALWLWRLDGMGRQLVLAEDDLLQVSPHASMLRRPYVAGRLEAES